ncbi:Nop53 [Necator americanus]|uniref:Ribosome biogenesis protein NOP53 n=1 Tax=Necator americanus TaxID=51031 RepID=W2TRT6_NECAM|nr:Nop53 [Necator americanus]ETN84750.1 Nop53 [Necator americanus]
MVLVAPGNYVNRMVSVSGSKTKTAASRTARHKKKYWRKGTDIADVEKIIHDKTYGSIADKPDHELFTIVRTPSADVKKYNKRQQAALDKISRALNEPEKLPLPSPKCPTSKNLPKLKQPIKRVEKEKSKPSAPNYDLWETDFAPKTSLEYEEAGEHMLRYTKKKLPNIPPTVRFKPSLLEAVAKPDAGTSYNPKAEDYENYVTKIAKDETKLMREEERIEKAKKPKHESIVTYAQKSLEETEGLVIDPRYDAKEEQYDGEGSEETKETDEKIVISHLMRKTRKQKLNAAKEKRLQREYKRRKEAEKKQHDVFKAKSINKKLAREEKEVAEIAKKRKKEKFLKKMTTRQQLGGGEFKDEEEPFLLQEELPDSLRRLKPQGHVLNDRLASLQKRNMLPIAGPRNKNKLKSKLKVSYNPR